MKVAGEVQEAKGDTKCCRSNVSKPAWSKIIGSLSRFAIFEEDEGEGNSLAVQTETDSYSNFHLTWKRRMRDWTCVSQSNGGGRNPKGETRGETTYIIFSSKCKNKKFRLFWFKHCKCKGSSS